MAGALNQLEFVGVGASRFTIIDRKSAERLAFAGEQRTRPNGTNSKRRHAVAIEIPRRISEDVGHIHRLSPIDGRTARPAFRTNRHAPCMGDKPWKTGRRGAIKLLAV